VGNVSNMMEKMKVESSQEKRQNDGEVRFTISVNIPIQMQEDIKLYARLRKIPISTFILNITKDYLMNHKPQDPFLEKYNSQEIGRKKE